MNLWRLLRLTIWVGMLFNLKDRWMTRIMTGGRRRRLLQPMRLISWYFSISFFSKNLVLIQELIRIFESGVCLIDLDQLIT
ncbi:hypothetical protein Hanom_Chr16g01492471 [Helianthus anomalus]